MVEVKFYKGSRGYESFSLKGHANYNPGNDIVCSAISGLGMALIGTLKNIKDLDITNCYYEDGNIDISINPFIDQYQQDNVDMVFKTVLIGLLQIQQSYPANIKIND